MMGILHTLMDNWEIVMASALAVAAGVDKVFLVAIATLGNVRTSWRSTFPKKEKKE